MSEGELKKRALYVEPFSFAYSTDYKHTMPVVSIEILEKAKADAPVVKDMCKDGYVVVNEWLVWFNKWFGEK
jgi:hypothetical protein